MEFRWILSINALNAIFALAAFSLWLPSRFSTEIDGGRALIGLVFAAAYGVIICFFSDPPLARPRTRDWVLLACGWVYALWSVFDVPKHLGLDPKRWSTLGQVPWLGVADDLVFTILAGLAILSFYTWSSRGDSTPRPTPLGQAGHVPAAETNETVQRELTEPLVRRMLAWGGLLLGFKLVGLFVVWLMLGQYTWLSFGVAGNMIYGEGATYQLPKADFPGATPIPLSGQTVALMISVLAHNGFGVHAAIYFTFAGMMILWHNYPALKKNRKGDPHFLPGYAYLISTGRESLQILGLIGTLLGLSGAVRALSPQAQAQPGAGGGGLPPGMAASLSLAFFVTLISLLLRMWFKFYTARYALASEEHRVEYGDLLARLESGSD